MDDAIRCRFGEQSLCRRSVADIQHPIHPGS
jgi:hypothetical protein